MNRIRLLLSALACVALAGCPSKNNDNPTPAGSASAKPSASPLATVAPSGAPAASGSASTATASGASAWSGSYTLAVGRLSIPSDNKDFAGVKQFKDDPSKHMGDGKIELTVTGEKVAGTVDGAAGPAIIDGSIVDGEIRGVVRRKDPKADGLTGTITAKIAGGDAEGKLSLADGTTAIIREATIALKKK